MPCQNQECTSIGGGQSLVNARVSGAYYAMVEAAKADGVQLYGNSTFRTMEHQRALCPCNGVTVARPGYSNHQMGIAIDFGNGDGGAIRNGDQWFNWLMSNAATFGIKNYPRESWHWSPTGS
jgi:zinc D-Ala-D-Ala carboxypeptidase